ncbi:MAG: Fic family protein [Mariprofundus sp.]
MLEMVLGALSKSHQVERMLSCMDDGWHSAQDMKGKLGLSHKATFRKNYLQPAIKLSLLVMSYPDHPRNPRQKYRKVI